MRNEVLGAGFLPDDDVKVISDESLSGYEGSIICCSKAVAVNVVDSAGNVQR